ncbi:MAG: hypothetical protein ABIA21_04085 [Candidatus Aenigmatarchaeota archaeon]
MKKEAIVQLAQKLGYEVTETLGLYNKGVESNFAGKIIPLPEDPTNYCIKYNPNIETMSTIELSQDLKYPANSGVYGVLSNPTHVPDFAVFDMIFEGSDDTFLSQIERWGIKLNITDPENLGNLTPQLRYKILKRIDETQVFPRVKTEWDNFDAFMSSHRH